MIVHWPAGIDEIREGNMVNAHGHVIDIMPTLVELTGARYPEEIDGRAITPMQGVSLLPLFDARPLPERRLYWEHEGNRAVREGAWKLVAKGIDGPWELYEMAEDGTETNNLASLEPDRVRELAAAWEQWAVEAGVYPMPKRNYWKGKQGPAGP